MNFKWNKDIKDPSRYNSYNSNFEPHFTEPPKEFLLPIGFKIFGLALAMFPIVYKLDFYFIHSALLKKVHLNDLVLYIFIAIGLAIEAKSESRENAKKTQQRRYFTLIGVGMIWTVFYYIFLQWLISLII